ncbi:MAG TPA: protocatechuate 3,4-dioxygenase subunit alpha [Candidatus Dormibacteraeota bacterium]|nr:protocatechuate 3,4-dioxygenase subunit alpha [Candidatus Dormibacteraeota bacterium]
MNKPTPSQTVGPFFGFALPFEHDYEASAGRNSVRVEGTLTDGQGEPVPDGLIEIWSDDEFARCRTDEEGGFRFVIARPKGNSSGGEAPHLEVAVFARGLLRHLQTRMYFPDDDRSNAADPVLEAVEASRRGTLIAERDGAVLRFDIRLQGERETVFFAI